MKALDKVAVETFLAYLTLMKAVGKAGSLILISLPQNWKRLIKFLALD
jgi:hypothetical protein